MEHLRAQWRRVAGESPEQHVEQFLSSIPSADAALVRRRMPSINHPPQGRSVSFAWFDPTEWSINFVKDSGTVGFALVAHEMTHCLDWAAGRISEKAAYKALVPRGFGRNWNGGRGAGIHSVPAEVFVDAYMAAHFPGKEGIAFDAIKNSDPERYEGLMTIANNVARVAGGQS